MSFLEWLSYSKIQVFYTDSKLAFSAINGNDPLYLIGEMNTLAYLLYVYIYIYSTNYKKARTLIISGQIC